TIANANINGVVIDFEQILFANAVSNETVIGELDPGEILCLSEKSLYNLAWGYVYDYEGSNLQSAMQNLYFTNLNLTENQKGHVVSQNFTSSMKNTLESIDQYFFPLAYRGEKFTITNYLSDKNKRIGYLLGGTSGNTYWLRSGYSNATYVAALVTTSGDFYHMSRVIDPYGVRPAFVLKI
ncbi:MAG: hypothetical protein IKK20_03465, partial [Clostridia bacterium]|nr:hypothetical protein [Clostridia bacterium]